MPDPRARHYWDGDHVVGRAYQKLELDGRTFDLGVEAWDLWLLFDRDTRWEDSAAPAPAWWEHQLPGMPPERHLEPKRFAAKAAELRARKRDGG